MDIGFVVLAGVAASYLLRSLMLFERDGHEGPFRSKTLYVRFPSSGHIQKVALFDWIRRLAGAYQVSDLFWDVRETQEAGERFTCPFCLSWWVALILSIPLSLLWFDGVITLLKWVIIHFAIAIISQIIYKWLWEND